MGSPGDPPLPLGDGLRLRTDISDRIDWQQLDLVVRWRDELDEPWAAMAHETGVKLCGGIMPETCSNQAWRN